MSDTSLQIDSHDIEISNPDKVLFPDAGLTKRDLIDYYLRIAKVALKHYRDRPLSMHRYPDGIKGDDFFQKHAPDYFPDWIERARLAKQDGEVDYVLANNSATLVYLADQACITPHLALARIDHPHHPDRMIFDLDPSDDDFSKVQQTAISLKNLLEDLRLPVFVQTSGSRGLHLVVPLDRKEDFDSVRAFSDRLTRHLANRNPELMTVEKRKDQRGDKIYLDVQRNAYGQTAVAPYAVRARSGAPIATPLRLSELGASDLGPRKYHVGNLFRRLAQIEDPWADMARHACSLKDARERFNDLDST
ncbi:MAG: non-homologous end-joining DNA ligase [Wenzhouxiangella sp.]|jgi:bifunctional non-homologous end joining protein LigD|nr:non-homologous end-joining DNA ligase [Wenzhouxiangella sp.]